MTIKNIVDLSLPLSNETPIFPGAPQPNIDVATTVENEGYNLFGVFVGSQSGSHVDAPYHFANEGNFVDKMNLDMFFGKGLKIVVPEKGASEAITLPDIEAALPLIKERPFVLIQTGWNDKTIGTDDFLNNPYINREAAQALVDAGTKFLGIDTINADSTGGEDFPVHDLFSSNNLMIGENWAHFADLTADEFYLSAFPLNMHTDGSPVRPVAIEVASSEQ